MFPSRETNPAAAVTRRILVKPREASRNQDDLSEDVDSFGMNDKEDEDSDFDTDGILHEVANLHVQLLSSEQELGGFAEPWR